MMFGFGILFMFVIPLLVIGGVAWLVLALARGSQGTALIPSARETPLDTLKVRYAKGEISKEQFEQMKRDLT
jgi:putative membrane protein